METVHCGFTCSMVFSIISYPLLCPKLFSYRLQSNMESDDERNGQHLHSASEQTPSQHLAQGTITAPMGYWHLHSTSTHVFRSAPSQHRPVCFTLAPSQHQGVCFYSKKIGAHDNSYIHAMDPNNFAGDINICSSLYTVYF